MRQMIVEDFRIRKTLAGYRVWQRVGPGWEALADVYGSRAEARAAIQKFTTHPA